MSADGGGTVAVYTLSGEPVGLLGALLIRLGFFGRTGRMIEKMARDAAAFASGQRQTTFDYLPRKLPDGAGERLEGMIAVLEQGAYGHGLARRLGEFIMTAQEVDLMHLRPRALARRWSVDWREVTELCLAAVKAGMMNMRWDLLCPRCRGAKFTVTTLDELPKGAHCPSCNIAYDGDFAHNVELTFQPSPRVREMELGEYCLSGPMTTPHVVVQQIVAPGERRSVVADLPSGAYRLRDLEPGQATDIDHGGGHFPTLIAEGGGVSSGAPAADGTIVLENRTAYELTLLIESRDWIADALTAHQATTLQAFRDLFTREVLRPGDEVAVSQVALMFTDLQRSTQFYERVGDARAYRLVREHFAFVGAAVRRCHGAVVKTIGDAVMAVFAEPAAALAAALEIQRDFAAFSPEERDAGLLIKMGLHLGPCIAVTLNERLDYFGSVFNMAARLQGESRGGEIVVSRDMAADPEVAKILGSVSLAEERADLKGFDHAVTFWRVAPQSLAASSA